MKPMRNVVLGIAEHDGKILVYKGISPDTGVPFYRPLGGGIEHCELSKDALPREFKEELNAEIEILGFLGVIEEVFEWNGKKAHQIFFNYRIRFLDPAFYEDRKFRVLDDSVTAFWKPISDFQNGDRLVPENLLNWL